MIIIIIVEIKINRKINVIPFQKECAFFKSIKKKETPINFITAKISTNKDA